MFIILYSHYIMPRKSLKKLRSTKRKRTVKRSMKRKRTVKRSTKRKRTVKRSKKRIQRKR